MDYSLSGSSVHGILQARLLEWVAISCSILSFYFQFVGSIHLERVLNLSNVFSASIEMIRCVSLILSMWNIILLDFYVLIHLFIPRDKFYFVMEYDHCNVLLDLVC